MSDFQHTPLRRTQTATSHHLRRPAGSSQEASPHTQYEHKLHVCDEIIEIIQTSWIVADNFCHLPRYKLPSVGDLFSDDSISATRRKQDGCSINSRQYLLPALCPPSGGSSRLWRRTIADGNSLAVSTVRFRDCVCPLSHRVFIHAISTATPDGDSSIGVSLALG